MYVMKTKGGITYIGVSLGERKKYFTDDAVIHVSKKFLKSYELISGMEEETKPVVINVTNKAQEVVKTEEPAAAPIEINSFDGDW